VLVVATVFEPRTRRYDLTSIIFLHLLMLSFRRLERVMFDFFSADCGHCDRGAKRNKDREK
jgi:hypothetical protein